MTQSSIQPMSAPDWHLIWGALGVAAALALLPLAAPARMVDKLTYLFIPIMFAAMWNLMAGYAGLVSVGQQVFDGLGGYGILRLFEAGVPPCPAIFVAVMMTGFVVWGMSWFVLRLRRRFPVRGWRFGNPMAQGDITPRRTAITAISGMTSWTCAAR